MAKTIYHLLGHEVDKETYDKYAKRKYPFQGRLVGLDGIHIWATDEEIAEVFPTQAAEAKQIIAQIEAAIGVGTQNAPQNAFHTFLNSLEDLRKANRSQAASLRKAAEIADQEYKRVCADSTATPIEKEYASVVLRKARAEHDAGFKELKRSQEAKTKEIRTAMEEYAANYYRVTADQMDATAVQLINSGVMGLSDLEHMSAQYKGNITMLKLIAQHAEQKGKDNSETGFRVLAHNLRSYTDPKPLFEAFDTVASAVRIGVNERANIEDAWDKHIAQAMEHAKGICEEYAPNRTAEE